MVENSGISFEVKMASSEFYSCGGNFVALGVGSHVAKSVGVTVVSIITIKIY